jgi:hypothetical protein
MALDEAANRLRDGLRALGDGDRVDAAVASGT